MIDKLNRVKELKSRLIEMALLRLSEQGKRLETIEEIKGIPKFKSNQDTVIYLYYKKINGEHIYEDISLLLKFVEDTPEYIEYNNLI